MVVALRRRGEAIALDVCGASERSYDIAEHREEMHPCLRGTARSHGRVRFAFDERFERLFFWRPRLRGRARDVGRPSREMRRCVLQAHGDGRSRILAFKFAKLPLPPEKPERISNARFELPCCLGYEMVLVAVLARLVCVVCKT